MIILITIAVFYDSDNKYYDNDYYDNDKDNDSNDNDSIYINVTSIHAACYLCQALTSTIKLILSVTDFHLIQFLLSNFTNYLSHNIYMTSI